MENAIVSIISTTLIILSTVIMMMTSLQATTKMAAAWQTMSTTFSNLHTTSISTVGVRYTGGPIYIDVTNSGQSNLYDFPKWDVIAQYANGTAIYLTYLESGFPDNNEWVIVNIQTASHSAEIFDPGILNPDEHLRMRIAIVPGLSWGGSARFTIATPSGIKDQYVITRE
jgi:hypothetical protein